MVGGYNIHPYVSRVALSCGGDGLVQPVCAELGSIDNAGIGILRYCVEAGVQISMDGKGRVFDNIFVERLWRTVKVEEVYLRDYQTVAEARYGLGRYFEFYNNRRFHQALGYRTPAEVYGVAPYGDVAVGTPVALRAPFVPTAVTDGGESILNTPVFCLDNG